jgi:hypothetical protein
VPTEADLERAGQLLAAARDIEEDARQRLAALRARIAHASAARGDEEVPLRPIEPAVPVDLIEPAAPAASIDLATPAAPIELATPAAPRTRTSEVEDDQLVPMELADDQLAPVKTDVPASRVSPSPPPTPARAGAAAAVARTPPPAPPPISARKAARKYSALFDLSDSKRPLPSITIPALRAGTDGD